MTNKFIKRLLCLLCFIQGMSLVAQQLPQYSQYMLNDFVLNPAIAGRSNYWEAKSNNRYQWVGIPDAPRTYMLSMQGPLKNLKMGLGGTLYTDIVGPTRRTGIDLSYAYHIKISKNYKLSFGISGGIVQYAVDGSKITTHDPGDPILSANYQSVIVPDIGAGVYFYSKKLSVSLGFPQIYQANLKFFAAQTTDQSKLAQHFYGLVTYKFNLGQDFILEPCVLVKYVAPVPVQIDGGLKLTYKNTVWIGANYRTNDAVSAIMGYMFKNWLMVGYSYDYSITPIRKYNSGTHEIMLGLRFLPPKKKITDDSK
ncbi:MAG: type IX secretion system membrane protein PorP/SprF [Bacteroidia bacterium]